MTRTRQEEYDAERARFVAYILQTASRLGFAVSARGWGYIFENHGIITKGQIDLAELFVNDCRKDGSLPLDICAVDPRRAVEGLQQIHGDIATS
jgi:hypothetical protein